MKIAVSDSSPLIALDHIGQLNLLEHFFSEISTPFAVIEEVGSLNLPNWIVKHTLDKPIDDNVVGTSLGAGEREVIHLALETKARLVILDDRPARRFAKTMNIPVIGTLGILLAAKKHGLLPAVQPCLDTLVQFNFRVAADLYNRVLCDAGEKI